MKDSAFYFRAYWYDQADDWDARVQRARAIGKAAPAAGKAALGMLIRAAWKLGVLLRNAIYALGAIGAGWLISLLEPHKDIASMMRALALLVVIVWYARRTRREWMRITPAKRCAKAHTAAATEPAQAVQMPTAPDMAPLAPPVKVKRQRKAAGSKRVSDAARCAIEDQLLEQFAAEFAGS